MNLQSVFEGLDNALEVFCNGMNSITEDLGKIDQDFHDDVKRSNSRSKSESKKHKQNIEKTFSSKTDQIYLIFKTKLSRNTVRMLLDVNTLFFEIVY